MNLYLYEGIGISMRHSLDHTPLQGDYTAHTHDRLELLYFMSGNAVYHVEGTEYPLRPGDIMVMNRAETHYIQVSPEMPYERTVIHFNQSFLSDLDPGGTLIRPFLDREAGHRNCYPDAMFADGIHRKLFALMESECADSRMQLIGNLMAVLCLLCGLSDRLETPAQGRENQMVSEIVRYLNGHLCDDISLQSVAEHFFVSKVQLCRIFRENVGSTVWNYVTAKRLLAARDSIRRGEAPTDVCAHCGFGEYSAFYRAYHKMFGESPAACARRK